MLKSLLIIFLSLQITFVGFGETLQHNIKESLVSKDFHFLNFQVNFSDKKAFLKWLAFDLRGDGTYVVMRSGDGKLFENLYTRKSAPSPNNIPLLFSFIDNNPLPEKSYYRVARIDNKGVVTYSDLVIMENSNKKKKDYSSTVKAIAK